MQIRVARRYWSGLPTAINAYASRHTYAIIGRDLLRLENSRSPGEVEVALSDKFAGAGSSGNVIYGAESVASPHKLAIPVVRSTVGQGGAGLTARAWTCEPGERPDNARGNVRAQGNVRGTG